MTVRELIELLQQCPPDYEVVIEQPMLPYQWATPQHVVPWKVVRSKITVPGFYEITSRFTKDAINVVTIK